MNLPQIDLSILPDLDSVVGLFGRVIEGAGGHDDSIVILATFVHETTGSLV